MSWFAREVKESAKIEVGLEFDKDALLKKIASEDSGTRYFTFSPLANSIIDEIRGRAAQAIWDKHKEEIIQSIDFEKLTPTLERLILNSLARKAIKDEL